MKRNIYNIIRFSFIAFLIFRFELRAQVGVDNPLPNPHSILDLKAIDKGLLIPRMTTAQRFTILSNCAPSCPTGLLVYDTDKKGLFYLDANQWFLMSPFIAPDASSGSAEVIHTDNTLVSDMGIGMAPAVGNKLQVNGNVKIEDQLIVTNQVTVQSGNLVVTSGSISSGGSITSSSNISASGTVRGSSYGAVGGTNFRSDGASNFSGPVPRGGIIMWSGLATSIPPGWSLCNGSNGTPDLRGRFVISAGSRPLRTMQANGTIVAGSNKTFNVDDVSGADEVILNVSDLPAHSHSVSINNGGSHSHRIVADGGGGGVFSGPTKMLQTSGDCTNCVGNYEGDTETDGSHSHTGSATDTGGDGAHSNLPPYYALAFIMKL